MSTPDLYRGQDYIDFPALQAACEALAAALPGWIALTQLGESRQGRPLLLLTVGRQDGEADNRPGFWLDGGTHAAEWTGVMAALYAASRWAEALLRGDAAAESWFSQHTAYVLPCISPDGFQAMMEGRPYLRSTLRPPRPGTTRSGFEPRDIDGDGAVRWMRWRHPAGPWVADPELPPLMRPRTVDDDPEQAFFLAEEGSFLRWDGLRWTAAPLEHGLDLNRNFPVDWKPFSMFGMDSGDYPASEPESRAVLEAVTSRPFISAALTNHTYTGCLLTAPHRADSPLPPGDVALLQALAKDATAGTGYKVFSIYPDFMYDPAKPIVGTWDDTLTTTFGIPGYTLECWDPFGWAGAANDKPVEMFRSPDLEKIRAILKKCLDEGSFVAWRAYEHPQLGPVELGGIDYMRTVRNPPVHLLAEECQRAFTVADRLRRALPSVQVKATAAHIGGDVYKLRLVLENHGALSTASLERGETIGASPAVWVEVELPPGCSLLEGDGQRTLAHLDGWMSNLHGFGRNPIYPGLPDRGHRAAAEWLVRAAAPDGGPAIVRWQAGRGGRGTAEIPLR